MPDEPPVRRATLVAHNGAAVFGGAERWTVGLLRRLGERGHRVLYLCRDPDIAERAEALGVPAEVAHLGGHASLHDAVRFAAQLRRIRPDGLLLSTFKKTWLGGMGARLARVPRVVARIGLSTDRPGRRIVYRVALRRWVHRIVVNADGLRAGVLADLSGVSPDRVITIYNAVEPPVRRAPEGALRRQLGIPPGAPLVGTLARLADQKRLDRLVRVVAALPARVHALVAGEGPERGALEALAREAGVADRFHMPGHREDVGDVLAALDVFVLTSDKEGMSNAMLEALAAGVPVVSTPVSGAEEALEPLEDGTRPGRIVPPDERALRAALEDLLGDPAARVAMGDAARRRARERFAPEDKVARWERLLAVDAGADVHEGPRRLVVPDASP